MISNGQYSDLGLTGRLIISMPQLEDGPFAKSVVLICRHDREHAMGLVVNKQIEGLDTQKAIPNLASQNKNADCGRPIFFGGPCETKRGLVLHPQSYQSAETCLVGNEFAITGTRDALAQFIENRFLPDRSRLFAGHAGWSAGQLDDELKQNFWLDMPADPAFLFDQSPEDMWDAAINEIGIEPGHLSAIGADTNAASRPLH